MLRLLRRAALLIAALAIPLYAVSFAETLKIPPAWREISVGDSHAGVRGRLLTSGLTDPQCAWLTRRHSVRCTLVGRHHAAGILIRFDGAGANARVAEVTVHEPVYTGPFHLHARLKHARR